VTRGNDLRPTRRLLSSRYGDYVVELRATLILIRPKGSRRGGRAEVAIPVGAAYQRALLSQMADAKRAKRKGRLKVKRGVQV
jgi:hypothetical protein